MSRALLLVCILAVFLCSGLAAPITGSVTISGTFVSPTPACIAPPNTEPVPGAECSGVGTANLIWGDSTGAGLNNSFSFNGGSFTNVARGQTFVAGLLCYHNGVSYDASEITSIVIRMVSASSTEQFNNQILTEPVLIVTTENGPDAEASADYIYFPNHPELGSFRIYEEQSATVQILAKFGSLDLVGFGDVVTDPLHPDSNPAAGFVNASVTPLDSVPEPSTLVLLGAGVIALVGGHARRLRR